MKRFLLALVATGLLSLSGFATAQPYDTQGQSVNDDDDSGHHSPASFLIGLGALALFGLYKLGSGVETSSKKTKGE